MNSEAEIFEAAAALPPAERAAYLDDACAGQPALRARIEALLRSHEVTGFMNGNALTVDSPTPGAEWAGVNPEAAGQSDWPLQTAGADR